MAEEMFTKARGEVLRLADSLDSRDIQEYHKMIATGLGCLETVLASNKLQPKVEAKVRLRYASILCEETNNIMEAETALAKGITLCEKVCSNPSIPRDTELLTWPLFSVSLRRYEVHDAIPAAENAVTKERKGCNDCRGSKNIRR